MKGRCRALVVPVVRELKLLVSEVNLEYGEQSLVYIVTVPVPQTDTGSQDEDSKANGRRVVKELGKLTP